MPIEPATSVAFELVQLKVIVEVAPVKQLARMACAGRVATPVERIAIWGGACEQARVAPMQLVGSRVLSGAGVGACLP